MVSSAREPIVLTGADIASATSGRLVRGDGRRAADRFSTDSRTLAPGEVFIALRGERFDGAAFAARAIEIGAAGVIVPADVVHAISHLRADAFVIAVDDTTRALQALGHFVRRQSGSRVVAVTGSAGKTTTKEAIAELLAERYTVYRNRGNLNNHIGLPISLLDLRTRPDVAVVELGMNHPGEIRLLVAVAEPDVRVWTNVGDAHMGFFESADAIADAKAEILEGAGPDSLLVANADDARVMSRSTSFKGRVLTFGMTARADVAATEVEDFGVDGSRARVRTPAGDLDLRVSLVGRGNLQNVLAAAAVALSFDVPLSAIARRAAALEAQPHRGARIQLAGGVTLVDDSNNSSPSALRQALEAVGRDRRHARRVAVLGEMLELGAFAVPLHEACGRAAAAAGLAALVTVGGEPARAMADAARAAGLTRAEYVPTSASAADRAAALVEAGDLVLVKGSRGIGTDAVVDRLQREWS
jgi:UDP-N-acetylmuramoyl-tripeptide--D-alanyl-D-alanine ligase